MEEEKNNQQSPVSNDGNEAYQELILKEYSNGNLVFLDFEGLKTIPLKDFVTQSADGILYDLNRTELVVLRFVEDPKWVNDYAAAKVIRELKMQVDEAQKLKMALPELQDCKNAAQNHADKKGGGEYTLAFKSFEAGINWALNWITSKKINIS